jgi:uncharacterized protein YutE (UPF0331/DUF86 family)
MPLKKKLDLDRIEGVKRLLQFSEHLERFFSSPFEQVQTEINRLRRKPRLVCFYTHGFVELMINTIVDHRCKHAKDINGDHRTYSHAAKLTLLHEMAVISDHTYNILNWLRKIRNDFVHKFFFELTPNRLQVFVDKKYQRPSQFGVICCLLLEEVLSAHEAELGPAFRAPLYQKAPMFTPRKIGERPFLVRHLLQLKSDPDDWVDGAKEIYEAERAKYAEIHRKRLKTIAAKKTVAKTSKPR